MDGLMDCPTLSFSLPRLQMLQAELGNQGNIAAALKSNGDMAMAFARTPRPAALSKDRSRRPAKNWSTTADIKARRSSG
ncbi:hypothetical protein [Mesorhizobium loti]|uniref:hypothetical protein n=1 Tax=Rhizobium loti TaxID=381 RepID=UPI000407BCA8|nr:hypothetical protein [Mesorhizobium loti]